MDGELFLLRRLSFFIRSQSSSSSKEILIRPRVLAKAHSDCTCHPFFSTVDDWVRVDSSRVE